MTLSVACFTLAVLGACKKEDQSQPVQPTGYDPSQTGYGQTQTGYTQPQAGYAQPQAGYAQPQAGYAQPQTGYAQPAATATAPAATAGEMNPSPQGLPCSSDLTCATHKCNTAVGKCSWPCVSAADCATGMQCAAPFCVPAGLPGLPTTQ